MGLTNEQAQAIYDVLVEHAGASPHPDDRLEFVSAHVFGRTPGGFRFIGALGFGGKFWVNGGDWYVTCYPEDETPQRRKIIETTCAALVDLRDRIG